MSKEVKIQGNEKMSLKSPKSLFYSDFAKFAQPLKDKLMSNCQIDLSTQCIEFGGALNAGYGAFTIDKKYNNLGYGFSVGAHRISYVLFYEKDLQNCEIVCHKCDNPSCFNPYHLFAGTFMDNHKDMVAKGRDKKPHVFKGEDSHKAKLTNFQVKEIRRKCSLGISHSVLAKEFNITTSNISKINTRMTFKDVI